MIDLSVLNDEQREAVKCTEGPLLVFAGAGSGKTRVLTHRLAHLIDKNVPAWSILAITFTNKAAREMRERVTKLCGSSADEAWVMTFHACCVRILRRDIEKLGYKREFTIYDEDDKAVLLKRICRELKYDDKKFPLRQVKAVISDAKNRLLSPEEWHMENTDQSRLPYFKIYEAYEKALRANNALDFDDLLIKALELLSEHPPVLESYQRKFSYIMVDEYQDTNAAQYQLIRLLAGERKNVCVVGDDDQSIYGWRGADYRNIKNFSADFPNCRIIKLETNYRSTGNILEAANKVVAHNRDRASKTLRTTAAPGDKIKLRRAYDEREEAAWICDEARALNNQGMSLGNMAVLYRTNAQSRVIEEAMVRQGIKYSVYGGLKFYDRKEIKDIVAYLRVIVNPDDDISLRRIINEPKRAIGESTVDLLQQYANDNGMTLLNAVLSANEAGLSGRALKAVEGFAQLLTDLSVNVFDESLSDFVIDLIETTGIKKQYQNSKDPEDESRVENINELVSAITDFEKQNPDAGLMGFLENVALVTDADRMQEEADFITLMTLHSAKGLEFDAVFLAGLEDGIFPMTRALDDFAQLEEERRLMYVGITRARKRLFMSCARNRMIYNQRQANPPSRFINEIPKSLIDDGRPLQQPVRLPPSAPGQSVNASRPTQGTVSIPGVSKGIAPQANRPRLNINPGDRVRHKAFGEGTVLEVRRLPSGTRVLIDFGRLGQRILDADSAPMTII